MIRTLISRGLLVTGLLVALAGMAGAQVTPENTVITNTATVSFRDANNNAYSASGSANVTVGFQPGVDVTAPATLAPSTPTVGATATFTINNTGNGTNQFSVAFVPPAGITVTGYTINGGGSYADVAALNTALAAVNVAAGGNVTVGVVYNTVIANAGVAYSFDLTASSVRAQPPGAGGNTSDAATITVTPADVTGVAVTPDASAATKIPGSQSAVFTVTNNGSQAVNFNLSAAGTAGFTIVSVNGNAGSTGTTGAIAAGGTANITVVYTIATSANSGTVTLTATHPTDAASTDNGTWDITVSKPAITLTKAAFLDDGTGNAPGAAVAGAVPPGVAVWYVITITNAGGAATAENVSVTDAIPAELNYVSSAGVSGTWTSISFAGGTVTATLNGTLAAGASASFRIKTTIK